MHIIYIAWYIYRHSVVLMYMSGSVFLSMTEQRLVQWSKTHIKRFCAWWRHQMEIFSALLAFVLGIRRSPENSPHKGQWRGALMLSLIYAWINGWVHNGEAGDLRRHRNHYDVIVMISFSLWWPTLLQTHLSSMNVIPACWLCDHKCFDNNERAFSTQFQNYFNIIISRAHWMTVCVAGNNAEIFADLTDSVIIGNNGLIRHCLSRQWEKTLHM